MSPVTKIKARGSALVVATTALALLLSGCTATGSDGPTTLVVQQSPEWTPMMDILVKKFEADNPGVKVELQSVTAEQKTSTNSQLIASSNAPDLALAPNDWRTLAGEGLLAPLDDLYKNQDLDTRYAQAMVDSSTLDGTTYAFGTDQNYDNLVYINKALFEQAGIEIPADHRIKSTEDLIDIVKKLNAIGVSGIAIGGTGGFQFGWLVDGLLPTSATDKELQNYLTNWQADVPFDSQYTDPAFLNVIKTIQSWGDGGVFADGYLAADYSIARGLYYQGQAGMLLSGGWEIGELEKQGVTFESDFLLLPPVDGGTDTKVSLLAGPSMVIPAKAKSIDLAKKFAELWVSDEMQVQAVANTGFGFPAVNTVQTSSLDVRPLTLQLIDAANTIGVSPNWTSIVPGTVSQTVIDPLVASMLAGAITPEDVAQKQQEAVEASRAAK